MITVLLNNQQTLISHCVFSGILNLLSFPEIQTHLATSGIARIIFQDIVSKFFDERNPEQFPSLVKSEKRTVDFEQARNLISTQHATIVSASLSILDCSEISEIYISDDFNPKISHIFNQFLFRLHKTISLEYAPKILQRTKIVKCIAETPESIELCNKLIKLLTPTTPENEFYEPPYFDFAQIAEKEYEMIFQNSQLKSHLQVNVDLMEVDHTLAKHGPICPYEQGSIDKQLDLLLENSSQKTSGLILDFIDTVDPNLSQISHLLPKIIGAKNSVLFVPYVLSLVLHNGSKSSVDDLISLILNDFSNVIFI